MGMNVMGCVNKTFGLQGESGSWPYPKRKLCAHQPVPWKQWKGMNVERGAEESFLRPNSDKLIVKGHWGYMFALPSQLWLHQNHDGDGKTIYMVARGDSELMLSGAI